MAKPAPMEESALSLREAAQRLGISSAELWKAACQGEVEAFRVQLDGREVWRFPVSSVEAWGASTGEPVDAQLKALSMLERSHQEVLRLQRQLTEVQLLAAQGQRLLAEQNHSRHVERTELQRERARAETLNEELELARSELARWEAFRRKPWWRRMFGTA